MNMMNPTAPALPTSASARIASRLLRVIESVLGAVLAGILVALLVVVLSAVLLRYVFSTGIMGSEDLGIWLHVALISLGAPLVINSVLAMRMDTITLRLSRRARMVTAMIADAFSVMTGLIMAFGSGEIALMLGGISPTLGLPEWVRFSFLGVGGVLVLLVLGLARLAEGRGLVFLVAAIAGTAVYVAVPYLAIDVSMPPVAILGIVVMIGIVVAAPLPHAFLAAAYVAVAFGSTLPEPAIVSSTVTGMSKFLLLAIPFFLLAGGLLTVSGVATDIVRFASSLVGHRRAGLAQTTLLTSVLFSGASGSSVANAAFGATTFQRELVKHGYRPAQAGAIIAATSVLDNVIPPSIAFLMLAAATNLSVGSLLVGGFFAGGVMAVCLAIAIHFTVRGQAPMPRASGQERMQSAIAAIPAFGLGIIVVAGIRMGIVTTTEAAALAAVYTIFLVIRARTPFASVYETFRQAATESSAIGLLIGTAGPFTFLLAVGNVSDLVSSWSISLGTGPVAVLLVINVILLIVGLALDIGAGILLFGPVFLPLAVAAGIDPVHFGVILVVNLMIGGLTPPVGVLIFVVSGVTRIPASALFREILPLLLALIVSLALISAWAIIL